MISWLVTPIDVGGLSERLPQGTPEQRRMALVAGLGIGYVVSFMGLLGPLSRGHAALWSVVWTAAVVWRMDEADELGAALGVVGVLLGLAVVGAGSTGLVYPYETNHYRMHETMLGRAATSLGAATFYPFAELVLIWVGRWIGEYRRLAWTTPEERVLEDEGGRA